MPPESLSLAVFVIQQAIKETPALIADFQALFASGQPTDADFDTVRFKVAGESYARFVPASVLTPDANDAAAAALVAAGVNVAPAVLAPETAANTTPPAAPTDSPAVTQPAPVKLPVLNHVSPMAVV